MAQIDLHTHTSYSDGTLSPADLVHLARELGIGTIAITDHDTTAGIAEGLVAGERAGIEVIPGIEVSAFLGSTAIHLLGFWIEPENELLRDRLSRLQADRRSRNESIIAKLRQLGIAITMNDLEHYTPEGQIGRPHIAKALQDKCVVGSIQAAFTRFLKRGRPAFVEKSIFPASEAIAMIRSAGGLCALAHPGTIHSREHATFEILLKALKDLGLDGLEVYYPEHQPATCRKLEGLAQSIGLFISGGSDFHGANRPHVNLGNIDGSFSIPAALLPPMRAVLEMRRAARL